MENSIAMPFLEPLGLMAESLGRLSFRLRIGTSGQPEVLLSFRRSGEAVSDEVSAAQAALADAQRVVAELQQTLAESVAKMTSAKAEYEHYAELAKVEQEKARPLIAQMDRALAKRVWRERGFAILIHLAVGAAFFLVGFFVGTGSA